jgi:protease PrsW
MAFYANFGEMWNTLTIVFNVAGVFLLFQFVRYKINDYLLEPNKALFWSFARHKYITAVGGMMLGSLVLVELILPDVSPLVEEATRAHFNTILGTAIALSISIIWMVYLRKLDVYEPEKWRHIVIVFVMGCLTVWLVFPMSGFLKNQLNFYLNDGFVNDFFYSWIGIGMTEEFVKMIPLLIIVRFRKIVNEPYDFLLYASVAALGFAFVENALYIQKTNFLATNGRALMSTVAHMTFSSVIGYSVMIASCRRPGQRWYFYVGGFLLASLMHGFFDFWLINPVAKQFSGLSFLFFILSAHFWVTLKSKAINASYFFDEKIEFVNDSYRYFIIFWMVALIMFSTVLIGIFHGSEMANDFLKGQIFAYGFLIYYLGFRFSRFVIAPKALAACQFAIEAVIPDEPEPKENWQEYYEEKHW